MTWGRPLLVGVLLSIAATSAVRGERLKVPFLTQERNGCGAASVSMVWRYWKERLPERTLDEPSPEDVYRQLYNPAAKGIALADMRRYLEEGGFGAYTLRGEWSDLEQQLSKGRPVVVGLKPRQTKAMHFVVVAGSEDGRVWLNDPTRSKPSRLSRDKFQKQWNLAERWMLLAVPLGPK